MSIYPHRNNLIDAVSPYLRQHADNPVWWQEWNREILEYAGEREKPLFVSVGYATCHWCHVMAAEAFSDPDVAAFLNTHFVSIKVDREERPDIDHFLMQFLLATRGNGGWPLNAFLSTPRRPVLALTYVPVTPRNELPGFVDIARQVVDFIDTRRDELRDVTFRISGAETEDAAGVVDSPRISIPDLETSRAEAIHRVGNLIRRFDRAHAGFGTGAKFPPHSSLLFLLHTVEIVPENERESVDMAIRRTLNVIARRGLHDHLQGGFFRYCVDQQWTIPHFEKMLYDQGLLLWVFALGYHRYRDEWYRDVAEGIVGSLQETFATGDVFVSAHDADTNHIEGETYLWSDDELQEFGEGSFVAFELIPGGNFEGKHHLLRRENGRLSDTERATVERLLARRRERAQPAIDRKVVTSWNALTGIGLLVAGRYLDRPEWIDRAWRLHTDLYHRNVTVDELDREIRVSRSSLANSRSNGEFLEDYAALLLFETYLAETLWGEDTADREGELQIDALRRGVLRFVDGDKTAGWVTSHTDDFDAIPADEFDAPIPSPVALGELSLARSDEFTSNPPFSSSLRSAVAEFGAEQVRDFHNIAVLFETGEFHVVHRDAPIDWSSTPIATMVVPTSRNDWCYRRVCRPGDPDWLRDHTK